MEGAGGGRVFQLLLIIMLRLARQDTHVSRTNRDQSERARQTPVPGSVEPQDRRPPRAKGRRGLPDRVRTEGCVWVTSAFWIRPRSFLKIANVFLRVYLFVFEKASG